MHELLVALSLVLVIEGVWPFLHPASYRRILLMVGAEGNRALRVAGLVSMLMGLSLLYLVN